MMYRVLKFMLLGVAAWSIGGCDISGEEQNFHFVPLRIVSVEIPETLEQNGLYVIKVVYERPDGCTFFEGFDVTDVDVTTRDIVAIGLVLLNTDTACTQAIEEVEANFAFRVLYTEPYTFRFYAGEDEGGNPVYLEYTVEVSEGASGQ